MTRSIRPVPCTIYTYGDAAHKQAVTAITGSQSFACDANGNPSIPLRASMTSRTDTTGSYTQVFDVENPPASPKPAQARPPLPTTPAGSG